MMPSSGLTYLKTELITALHRAEKAETERAEVSRLLAAREQDIEELKRRLDKHKTQYMKDRKMTFLQRDSSDMKKS